MKAVIFSSGFNRDAGRWVLIGAQLDRLRNYCSFKGLEIAKDLPLLKVRSTAKGLSFTKPLITLNGKVS